MEKKNNSGMRVYRIFLRPEILANLIQWKSGGFCLTEEWWFGMKGKLQIKLMKKMEKTPNV